MENNEQKLNWRDFILPRCLRGPAVVNDVQRWLTLKVVINSRGILQSYSKVRTSIAEPVAVPL